MPGRTVRKMIAGAVFSHPVIIQLFARFQVGLSANDALSVQSGSRRSVNPRILRRCWLGQATPGPRESSRSDPELNSSRLARRFRVPLRRHADVIEPFDPLPTNPHWGISGPSVYPTPPGQYIRPARRCAFRGHADFPRRPAVPCARGARLGLARRLRKIL